MLTLNFLKIPRNIKIEITYSCYEVSNCPFFCFPEAAAYPPPSWTEIMACCKSKRIVDKTLRKFFYWLGSTIGQSPWYFIIVPVLITALLATGMYLFIYWCDTFWWYSYLPSMLDFFFFIIVTIYIHNEVNELSHNILTHNLLSRYLKDCSRIMIHDIVW